MTPHEKAAAYVAKQSTATLCDTLELTGTVYMTDHTPTVRGWIMDELERRDPDAFGRWLDSNDVKEIEKPSLFFLP